MSIRDLLKSCATGKEEIGTSLEERIRAWASSAEGARLLRESLKRDCDSSAMLRKEMAVSTDSLTQHFTV